MLKWYENYIKIFCLIFVYERHFVLLHLVPIKSQHDVFQRVDRFSNHSILGENFDSACRRYLAYLCSIFFIITNIPSPSRVQLLLLYNNSMLVTLMFTNIQYLCILIIYSYIIVEYCPDKTARLSKHLGMWQVNKRSNTDIWLHFI